MPSLKSETETPINPPEARGPRNGDLPAYIAGLMLGLPGIVIEGGDPETWPNRPVVLPKGWTAIEIGRVWVRGRPMRLLARHGADRAELTPTA